MAGYSVWITRNGAPPGAAPDLAVTEPSVTVAGSYGDTVAIQVAAFDIAGSQGPMSPPSDGVQLLAPPTPPPPPDAPPWLVLEAASDISLGDALALAAERGEQLTLHMNGTGKRFLDLDVTSEHVTDPFGFDQLVVGNIDSPTTVRLIDALGIEERTPLAELPPVTLFGLGNGPPCARDGAVGLRILPGSTLVLGGVDLHVFDGQRCVYINELFDAASDSRETDSPTQVLEKIAR